MVAKFTRVSSQKEDNKRLKAEPMVKANPITLTPKPRDYLSTAGLTLEDALKTRAKRTKKRK